LELIHTDIWGPAATVSTSGYKYYISFIDAHSRFTWLYLLKTKGEALNTFLIFKNLVEKQFNVPIKAIQSDGGGEFVAFREFLLQEGVTHKISCPHTHEQNGVVERRHRHIVETGLTLLHQSSLHLKY
jgi:histone deacetylase 1/2